ncbi:hypothetical protein DFJ63DRAFT_316462 [Scheffersomyces coipomensis]|uniref:uncharacterized protein n=1 Tax=Scheffersomyces coipomensis TaxID=1788519 RepID=UPI00315CE5F9
MNANQYLKSFGWKEGEALQEGGLKKPLLVKHKKDTKGLGHDANDADVWWEKLFDGQLKSLEINNGSSGEVSFKQNSSQVISHMRKETSVLYRMFVKGEGLQGTVGKTDHTKTKDHIIASKVAKDIDEALHSNRLEVEEVIETKIKEKKVKSDKKEKKSKKDEKSNDKKIKKEKKSSKKDKKEKSKSKKDDKISSKVSKKVKSDKKEHKKKSKDITKDETSSSSKKRKRDSSEDDSSNRDKKKSKKEKK